MGSLSWANLRKTYYYLKRNGWKHTWAAARERLAQHAEEAYCYQPLSEAKQKQQREASGQMSVSFSILVPTFRTPEPYLRELIDSVLAQTYSHFELILADATEAENRSVEQVVATYPDDRIRYVKLAENRGISENTNQALQQATGDYVGLLDHDDLLTPDALYEMACRVTEGKQRGMEPVLLYSDEDKCNGDGTLFYDPNRKEEFNLDLIFSNNYICHFTVLKREWFQELPLRAEYDGAQDYDLVLRVVERLWRQPFTAEEQILHIPKVLYHWRCHSASTAENPQSKSYAYVAGRRALQDLADRLQWRAEAVDLKHVGFYRLEYHPSVLQVREDIGAVGGKLLHRHRIVGGRMSENGTVYYEGLPETYSGYLHRAALTQDAEAVDIRCIQVRQECWEVFEQVVGVPYTTISDGSRFDSDTLPVGTDYRAMSVKLGQALRQKGYRICWDPEWACKQSGR